MRNVGERWSTHYPDHNDLQKWKLFTVDFVTSENFFVKSMNNPDKRKVLIKVKWIDLGRHTITFSN